MQPLRDSRFAEDAIGNRTCAICKIFDFNFHRAEDAQEHVGHFGLVLAPIGPMFQAHVRTTSDKRWQILRPMRRTGTTTKQYDRIVQQRSLMILILSKTLQEMGRLLHQEPIVFRKL